MKAFERLQQRLLEKAGDANARAVTYVAIGDSVTQGCMQFGVIEYENAYHQVVRRGFEKKYPGTVINVINSGVGGDTLVASRGRWDRDLFMYKPDLVTICFGHNDAHGRQEGLSSFIETLTELVGRIRGETDAELLLMTPCMMMKKDNPKVEEVHRTLVADFVKLAEDGILQLYVDAIRQLAADQDIPLYDSYAMWEQMERDQVDIHRYLSNGINHPDPGFHVIWGEALLETLN